jgi:hypothetical protein
MLEAAVWLCQKASWTRCRHAAITKPIVELADVAAAAWRLSLRPVVRSKYPVTLADLLHPCYAKMRFRRACDSNQDRPRLTGPSDIPIYKVMAISPWLDQRMVVLLWPLRLALIDLMPSGCTAFINN